MYVYKLVQENAYGTCFECKMGFSQHKSHYPRSSFYIICVLYMEGLGDCQHNEAHFLEAWDHLEGAEDAEGPQVVGDHREIWGLVTSTAVLDDLWHERLGEIEGLLVRMPKRFFYKNISCIYDLVKGQMKLNFLWHSQNPDGKHIIKGQETMESRNILLEMQSKDLCTIWLQNILEHMSQILGPVSRLCPKLKIHN